MGTWYTAGSGGKLGILAVGGDRVYDPFVPVFGSFASPPCVWAAATGVLTYAGAYGQRVSGAHTPPAEMGSTRFTMLPDGRIFACGGYTGSASVASSAFGTISGNTVTWVAGNDVYATLNKHHLGTLSDGRLVCFGGTGLLTLDEIRLGTVSGNTTSWVAVTPGAESTVWDALYTACRTLNERSKLVLLPDGKLLVLSGVITTGGATTYWLITVTGNTVSVSQYSATLPSPPAIAMGGATPVLMVDGRILYGAGFYTGNANSNKFWEGTFSGTTLSFARVANSPETDSSVLSVRHAFVLLANGNIGKTSIVSGSETSMGDSYYVPDGFTLGIGTLSSTGSSTAAFGGSTGAGYSPVATSFSMTGASTASFAYVRLKIRSARFAIEGAGQASFKSPPVKAAAFSMPAVSAAAFTGVRVSAGAAVAAGSSNASFEAQPIQTGQFVFTGEGTALFTGRSICRVGFSASGKTIIDFRSPVQVGGRLSSNGKSAATFFSVLDPKEYDVFFLLSRPAEVVVMTRNPA